MKDNWIEVIDGKFTCSECFNTGELEIVTSEGTVKANLEEVKSTLEKFPSKVIFAVCPTCGMEYVFKLHEGELWLEPSEEEK